MRKLTLFAVLCVLVSSCASNSAFQDGRSRDVASVDDCSKKRPDQIIFCDKVGVKKDFGFDSIKLLDAISENHSEFQELTSDSRSVKQVLVEILPAKEDYLTKVVQFTIFAGRFKPPMGGSSFKTDDVKVVWQYYHRKNVMDGPGLTYWESSGIIKADKTPKMVIVK